MTTYKVIEQERLHYGDRNKIMGGGALTAKEYEGTFRGGGRVLCP